MNGSSLPLHTFVPLGASFLVFISSEYVSHVPLYIKSCSVISWFHRCWREWTQPYSWHAWSLDYSSLFWTVQSYTETRYAWVLPSDRSSVFAFWHIYILIAIWRVIYYSPKADMFGLLLNSKHLLPKVWKYIAMEHKYVIERASVTVLFHALQRFDRRQKISQNEWLLENSP